MNASAPLWRVSEPKIWPPRPTHIAFSTFVEIEECPRRWGLRHGSYPDLWQGPGYPGSFNVSGLIGSIIHLSISKIVSALTDAGCSSMHDPMTVQALKSLGGITAVLKESASSVIEAERQNPRIARLLEVSEQVIASKLPEMRQRVQLFLSRIRLHPTHRHDHGKGVGNRNALGLGSHAEVELFAPDLGWVGIADLINISESECEIVDFKTGSPSSKHAFQLRVYSLLWALDTVANPSGRLATRLTVSYLDEDVSIPALTKDEVDLFKVELMERTGIALTAATRNPPEARPSYENCRICDVRQSCDEYWSPAIQRRLALEAKTNQGFWDAEILVAARHGPLSWDGTLIVSGQLPQGKKVLLRTVSGGFEPRVGDRVRVLGAHLAPTASDEDEPFIVTLTTASEVFFIT